MNTNLPPRGDGRPPDSVGGGFRARFLYQKASTGGVPEGHATARAAFVKGDYATAIEEYRKVIAANPEDALAHREISRAWEKLDDPGAAAATLEEALGREWSQADAALLCMALVEVNWNHYHDAATCRALLMQIKETMPGTTYAADAQKRLHQLNEQVQKRY